jgi:hypothetical protein
MIFANPILHAMAVSYDKFLVRYTENTDFKKSFIMDNEAITLGIRKK